MKRQRENGEKAEAVVRKFFRATSSLVDEYDLETRHCCIEVKSCDAFARSGKKWQQHRYQLGRFAIDKKNHASFKRLADDAHKRALYAFVVRIGKASIMKVVDWSLVTLPPKKVRAHLSWQRVWELS